MKDLVYPVIQVTYDTEDEAGIAYANQQNWVAQKTAETHAMVSEMYEIFAQLKPMMGMMPKMPPGMVPPGLPKF